MASNPHLHPPARTDRLSDQVAAQLQQLVVTHVLRPGEKIPSERELCETLGVSRTVVREAVRSLVVKGLLEVRQGGGTVVRSPDNAIVTELMTMMLRAGPADVAFAHMHEVRRLLEIEIAGLAAERRTEDDLRNMEEQLRRMVLFEQEHEHWAAADLAFHTAIATATHNPLYPVLLNSIADMLMEVRLQAIRLAETPRVAQHYHRVILENIQRSDVAGARRAMEQHLYESESTFQRARLSNS
jgi:GntR family transcriptional regulator, transcriptional repressor for pyruvate dehydrogenase complex